MKKKTTKSYFFNEFLKNPATNYSFCFSKRAFKQNKQQQKIKQRLKNLRKSKKRTELIQYFVNYKNNISLKVSLNQWNKNNNKIVSFFLNSYYNTKKQQALLYRKKPMYNKTTKKQFKIWLVFKNFFYKKLHAQLRAFPKTGILSSHYVHVLSRKNMTYQTRSKYRSKTLNLNFFNYYFYFFTKFMYTYVHSLNNQLYYFSTNVSHKNSWVDEDFYTNKTTWYDTTTNIKKFSYVNVIYRSSFIKLFNINVENYVESDVSDIHKHKKLIADFFSEEDQKKKENKFLDLTQKLQPNSLNYVYAINLFIVSAYFKKYNYNVLKQIHKCVFVFLSMYKLNINDI